MADVRYYGTGRRKHAAARVFSSLLETVKSQLTVAISANTSVMRH